MLSHPLAYWGFNPRTRDGCEVCLVCTYNSRLRFNPRTRDGCEEYLDIDYMSLTVSIHAPVMGANFLTG